MKHSRRGFLQATGSAPFIASAFQGTVAELEVRGKLQARVALFPLTAKSFVHDPTNPIHPHKCFDPACFDRALAIATVQWSSDPAIGFPLKPYEVFVANNF